jgi:hypothetical protein
MERLKVIQNRCGTVASLVCVIWAHSWGFIQKTWLNNSEQVVRM